MGWFKADCGYSAARMKNEHEMVPVEAQLKPSKWPFRMRSPMGEGARRGLVPSIMVAERRGLVSRGREKGLDFAMGLTAEFGGGLGGNPGERGSICVE